MKIFIIAIFWSLLIFSNAKAQFDAPNLVTTQIENTTVSEKADFSIQAAHTALWYSPNQNGHGINVYLLENNRILVIWYVYTDDGNPLWLLGVGTHDGITATLDVTQHNGAKFPPDFNAMDVISKDWGAFQLSFTGCDSGLFSWQPVVGNGFSSGEMSINRLTQTLGLNCNSQKNTATTNTNISDGKAQLTMNEGLSALWYNPSESGHGINVYMLTNNRIVVIWYVYDKQGNPIWLLGVGDHDGVKATMAVQKGSGAKFPPNFISSDVILDDWGTFELEFSACNTGKFSWSPVSGNGFTAGQADIQRLTHTLGLTCTEEAINTQAVTQADFLGNSDYRVLAANDLGMHCADLDYQIFSILPPFNNVHAQVIKRGDNPTLMTPNKAEISLYYSATANPNDPILDNNNPSMPALLNPANSLLTGTSRAAISINSTSQNDDTIGLTKSNFWDNNPNTNQPYGFDSYDNIFFGLLDPNSIIFDIGLPVADSILLPDCLSNPSTCEFAQQSSSGINNPYKSNQPQIFHRFDKDVNFFSSVLPSPLGEVVQNSNWWTADGIPMLPIDDAGRNNPYPLMRIQAKLNNSTVASTDIVLPVASEADCQNCHALMIDCADMDLSALIQSDSCNESAISPTSKTQSIFEVISMDDSP